MAKAKKPAKKRKAKAKAKRGPKSGAKSPGTEEGRTKAGQSAGEHNRQINDTGLTDQQFRFVQHYLIHLNATKAAELAGYSEHTAHSQGTQLLSHRRIREVLAKKMNERNLQLDVTAGRVLLEVASMAYSNIDDIASWKGGHVTLKDSAKLSRIQKASIRSLNPKFDREGRPLGVKVTFHDKPKAAELLMRHMGLLDPTGRQDTKGTIVAFMERLHKGKGVEE